VDQNEIIALSIVALASYLALRYFMGKKGGGCCGSGCLPKFEKKDGPSKTKEKK